MLNRIAARLLAPFRPWTPSPAKQDPPNAERSHIDWHKVFATAALVLSVSSAVSALPVATQGPVGHAAQAVLAAAPDAHPAPSSADVRLQAVLQRDIPRWNPSHPDRLSRRAIRQAEKNPQVQGEDAAALATVAGNYSSLAKAHWGRYTTLSEIDACHLGNRFDSNVTRLSRQSHQLFNGPIDFKAMDQGDVGDCYFLSALDDEARLHPDMVMGWAHENANHSITITFPRRKPQTVAPPTDTQLLVHASSGSNGEWATVYEQAWEQSHHPILGMKGEWGDHGTTGIRAVTGHQARDVASQNMTVAQMGRALTEAQDHGRIVTASTWHHTYQNGVIKSHVYSVEHYDADTQTITARNPWGGSVPAFARDLGDGRFCCSLATFANNFESLTYER